jgi:hypothetical protein
MDSLTTAYLVCMLIGSVSAIGAAFVGNKMFPIESSLISLPVVESAAPVADPPQNIEQTVPEVSSTTQ